MIPFETSNFVKKINRAKKKSLALKESILIWITNHPPKAEPKISKDRHGWILKIKVSSPPEEDWAGELSEITHLLRSALENLLAEVAKADNVIDKKSLRNLKFPICSTHNQWKKEKAQISCLSATVQNRIFNTQPFLRSPTEKDPLALLKTFNNHDKHGISWVVPEERITSLGHTFIVEFDTEQNASISTPPDVTFYAGKVFEDKVLLRQKTKGRIKKVRGSCTVGAEIQASHEGMVLVLNNCDLEQICDYTRMVASYVVKGDFSL